MGCDRRKFLALGAAAALAPALPVWARRPFRLGLTPVFLDNDALVIERLRKALVGALGGAVEMEQPRTYKEVTAMLLNGELDAAWLCGHPYLQHEDQLAVVSVPVWNGRPLYRSYLIVDRQDRASSLDDLRDDIHAFSDPDSNSGFLVTASELAKRGLRPDSFFGRSFFTYGHRNVVRAVASGLARSGSVDGYVWEVLARMEPALTRRTKVIWRSEWLGFPPICARKDRIGDRDVRVFTRAALDLDRTAAGRAALSLLRLDAMTPTTPTLFDGIKRRMQVLKDLG